MAVRSTPQPPLTLPTLVPQGQHLGKPVMPLNRPLILIGSRHRAHLHLLSPTISKSHAIIINTDSGSYIRDLASRTHVIVNGRQVKEAELNEGDLVKIGNFTFQFTDPTRRASFRPGPRAPEAALEVEGAPISVPIEGLSALIGRRPTCDIPLTENSVSTAHAIIFELNGQHYLRDLGSRTGTYINGRPIHQEPLNANDVIRVGDTDMRYVPANVEAEEPASRSTGTPHLVGLAELHALNQTADALDPGEFVQEDSAQDLSLAPPAAEEAHGSDLIPLAGEDELLPIESEPVPQEAQNDQANLADLGLAPEDDFVHSGNGHGTAIPLAESAPAPAPPEPEHLPNVAHAHHDQIDIAADERQSLAEMPVHDRLSASHTFGELPGHAHEAHPTRAPAVPEQFPAPQAEAELIPLDLSSLEPFDQPLSEATAPEEPLHLVHPPLPLEEQPPVAVTPEPEPGAVEAPLPLAPELAREEEEVTEPVAQENANEWLPPELPEPASTPPAPLHEDDLLGLEGFASPLHPMDSDEHRAAAPSPMGAPIPPSPQNFVGEGIPSAALADMMDLGLSPGGLEWSAPASSSPLGHGASSTGQAPTSHDHSADLTDLGLSPWKQDWAPSEVHEIPGPVEPAASEPPVMPQAHEEHAPIDDSLLTDSPGHSAQPAQDIGDWTDLGLSPWKADWTPSETVAPSVPTAETPASAPPPEPSEELSLESSEAPDLSDITDLGLSAWKESWHPKDDSLSVREPISRPAAPQEEPPAPDAPRAGLELEDVDLSGLVRHLDTIQHPENDPLGLDFSNESAESDSGSAAPRPLLDLGVGPSDTSAAPPDSDASSAPEMPVPLIAPDALEMPAAPETGRRKKPAKEKKEKQPPKPKPAKGKFKWGRRSKDALDAAALEAAAPVVPTILPAASLVAGITSLPSDAVETSESSEAPPMQAESPEAMEASPSVVESVTDDMALAAEAEVLEPTEPTPESALEFGQSMAGLEPLVAGHVPEIGASSSTDATPIELGEDALLDEDKSDAQYREPTAPLSDTHFGQAVQEFAGTELGPIVEESAPSSPEPIAEESEATSFASDSHDDAASADEAASIGESAEGAFVQPEIASLDASDSELQPQRAEDVSFDDLVAEDLLAPDSATSATETPLGEKPTSEPVLDAVELEEVFDVGVSLTAEDSAAGVQALTEAAALAPDPSETMGLEALDPAPHLNDIGTPPESAATADLLEPDEFSAHSSPAPIDPFFGMSRDSGTFIGGMPLPLPEVRSETPPTPAPVAKTPVPPAAPAPPPHPEVSSTTQGEEELLTFPDEPDPLAGLTDGVPQVTEEPLDLFDETAEKLDFLPEAPETIGDVTGALAEPPVAPEPPKPKRVVPPPPPRPRQNLQRPLARSPFDIGPDDAAAGSIEIPPFAGNKPATAGKVTAAFDGLAMPPVREADVFSQMAVSPALSAGLNRKATAAAEAPLAGLASAADAASRRKPRPAEPSAVLPPSADAPHDPLAIDAPRPRGGRSLKAARADRHGTDGPEMIPRRPPAYGPGAFPRTGPGAAPARGLPPDLAADVDAAEQTVVPAAESQPALSAAEGAPPRSRWLSLRLLVPIMIVLMAVIAILIWRFLPVQSTTHGILQFDGLKNLSRAARDDFAARQRERLGDANFKTIALATLKHDSPGVSEGFLGSAADPRLYENFITKVRNSEAGDGLVLEHKGPDAAADRARIAAVMQALYTENGALKDNANRRSGSFQQARDALAKTMAAREDADRQVKSFSDQVRKSGHPQAENIVHNPEEGVKRLEEEGVKLEKDWAAATQEVHRLQNAVQQRPAEVSAAPPAVDPATDPQVKELTDQLAELTDTLAAARAGRNDQGDQATRTFQATVADLEKSFADARAAAKSHPKLASWLDRAQEPLKQLHDSTAALLRQQKLDAAGVEQLRQQQDKQRLDRLNDTWSADAQLKAWQQDLSVKIRHANAAQSDGLKDEAAKLQGQIEVLNKQIESRHKLLAVDDRDTASERAVQQAVDAMNKNRARFDEEIQGELRQLTQMTPVRQKLDGLADADRKLAEQLAQRVAAAEQARKEYGAALAAAWSDGDATVTLFQSRIIDQQAKLNARKRQVIAEASDARSQQGDQSQVSNDRTALQEAQKAELSAGEAYTSNRKLLATVSSLREATGRLAQARADLLVKQQDVDSAQAAVAAAPMPRAPDLAAIESIPEPDHRALYIVLSMALVLVAFGVPIWNSLSPPVSHQAPFAESFDPEFADADQAYHNHATLQEDEEAIAV